MLLAETNTEELLHHIYENCEGLIPYDRIGWAEILPDQDRVRARWARSATRILLRTGYSAQLAGSSLYFVMEQRKPRVMDDLCKYLENRPDSRSTQLMVREGIRSSLTCPLFVADRPLGFLFFSSFEPEAYANESVAFAMQVARLLSLQIAKEDIVAPDVDDVDHQLLPDTQQHVPILELESGMVLSESLIDASGHLLLASGHKLEDYSVGRLVELFGQGRLGFNSVRVD
jgi:transcriptional regulator with GAF, ATPase, and Fis domain